MTLRLVLDPTSDPVLDPAMTPEKIVDRLRDLANAFDPNHKENEPLANLIRDLCLEIEADINAEAKLETDPPLDDRDDFIQSVQDLAQKRLQTGVIRPEQVGPTTFAQSRLHEEDTPAPFPTSGLCFPFTLTSTPPSTPPADNASQQVTMKPGMTVTLGVKGGPVYQSTAAINPARPPIEL